MRKITVIALLLVTTTLIARSQASLAYMGMVQKIPGKVECERYNNGREGIAYHDTDSINNGSGKLNPANGSFLNEFRMTEAVDISYTKSNDIDNTRFNKAMPQMEQLYVGWTQPGEWIKYQVDVTETGTYAMDLMYTANGDGIIAIDVDGKEVFKSTIPSTFDAADTVAWRQWHHWNKASSIGMLELKKGYHIITLHTVDHGNMNYDFLEFRKIEKEKKKSGKRSQ